MGNEQLPGFEETLDDLRERFLVDSDIAQAEIDLCEGRGYELKDGQLVELT